MRSQPGTKRMPDWSSTSKPARSRIPRPRGAVGLLVAIAVPVERLQERRQRRPEKGVVPVRHADDGNATRPEDAIDLADRLFGLVEVLDGSHRIHRVERRVPERDARTSATAPRSGTDPKLRRASRAIGADRSTPNARAPRDAAHCRIRVFLASSTDRSSGSAALSAAAASPRASESRSPIERRGRRAAEIGKVVSDVVPEAVICLVALPGSTRCAHEGSVLHVQAPTANASRLSDSMEIGVEARR